MKSAGMAIKTGGSAVAKTTVAVLYKISDVIYTALSAGDLPALTGISVADGYTKCVLVQVSAGGTVTYKVSDAFANVSGEVFVLANAPSLDKDKAFVGFIVIKNASGSVFTGGTTALDASNVTVSYIDYPVIGA